MQAAEAASGAVEPDEEEGQDEMEEIDVGAPIGSTSGVKRSREGEAQEEEAEQRRRERRAREAKENEVEEEDEDQDDEMDDMEEVA